KPRLRGDLALLGKPAARRNRRAQARRLARRDPPRVLARPDRPLHAGKADGVRAAESGGAQGQKPGAAAALRGLFLHRSAVPAAQRQETGAGILRKVDRNRYQDVSGIRIREYRGRTSEVSFPSETSLSLQAEPPCRRYATAEALPDQRCSISCSRSRRFAATKSNGWPAPDNGLTV